VLAILLFDVICAYVVNMPCCIIATLAATGIGHRWCRIDMLRS
jgi:hypothetical protein